MEKISQRFEHVLSHIDNNLTSRLDCKLLASIAQVPECHFDFIFHSLFHTRTEDYIGLLRNLEAAQQLGFDKAIPISTVAESAGFASEASFTEAFTKAIGQSPSQFQLTPDWGNFFEKQQPLKTLSEGHDELTAEQANIELVELEAIPLIAIEHRTQAQYLPQTIEAMRAFRQAHQLSPDTSRTFNFIYQSAAEPLQQFNIDIAASVTQTQKADLRSVIDVSDYFMESMIPAGRYATFLHSGSDEDLNKKVKYLYGNWLNEQSQNKPIQLKNLPLIFEKLNITQPQQIKTRVYLGFV